MGPLASATGRWGVFGGYAVLLSAVAVFSLATLREGHDWGDDFAMYIHHAKNLAEGLPYGATGYIYNPNNPVVGPIVYPPGYPLLLAPVYKLFGLDVHAMRVELLAVFLVDMALVAVLFREYLSRASLLVLVAALGFSPGLWRLRQEVLSDLVFLLFCLTTILVLRYVEKREETRTAVIVLLGVSAYLAFATRTIGALLLVSIIVSDLILNRRLTRLTVAPLAVCAVLALLQRIIIGPFESYVDQLILSPRQLVEQVISNVALCLEALGEVGGGSAPQDAVAVVFTLAAIGIAVVGFSKKLPPVFVVFPALYVAAIMVWPSFQGVRFLLPVLPFLGFFVIRGLSSFRFGSAAAACLLTIGYVNFYAHALNSPPDYGVFAPGAQQLFTVVREQSKPDDVFVFFKPRALSLFTDRRASAYHWAPNQENWRAYLLSINARFVIVGPQDAEWSSRYVAADSRHYTEVYSDTEFTIYRVAAGD